MFSFSLNSRFEISSTIYLQLSCAGSKFQIVFQAFSTTAAKLRLPDTSMYLSQIQNVFVPIEDCISISNSLNCFPLQQHSWDYIPNTSDTNTNTKHKERNEQVSNRVSRIFHHGGKVETTKHIDIDTRGRFGSLGNTTERINRQVNWNTSLVESFCGVC